MRQGDNKQRKGNVVKMSSAIPNLKTALKQILKLKDVFDPHQLTLFE
jgi:hypothetical protein